MEKILVKKQDNQKEILEMCKVSTAEVAKKYVLTELDRDMFKGNEYILNKYFKNENNEDCCYANLLAFRGLKVRVSGKTRTIIKAPKIEFTKKEQKALEKLNVTIEDLTLYDMKKVLRDDFGREVSLAGYKYNPEHYKFAQAYMQDEYEEDLFKNKSKEEELAEYEAERRARVEPLDFSALDSLYNVLYKAIKSRLVMILHLESVPGILNNALDCYYKGVSCGASNGAMNAKIAEIRQLLEDEEVIKWLKTNPTDLMFDEAEYVETYQKVLRQLTNITDEPLEYCRDLLENPEDEFIDKIIANDYIEPTSFDEKFVSYDYDKNEYIFIEDIDDDDCYLD
jgi:hypothetical protein